MTMVLRQSPPGHKSRCLEDDVVLAIDNTTKNVIHYQKVQEQEEFEFPVVGKNNRVVLCQAVESDCRLSPFSEVFDLSRALHFV